MGCGCGCETEEKKHEHCGKEMTLKEDKYVCSECGFEEDCKDDKEEECC